MYDFYKNLPNSKKELREWLTDWLQPVPEGIPPFIQDEEAFTQLYGFRRCSYMHCVFQSLKTGEYVWSVFEDCDIPTISNRFATYEELLEHVIDDYYVLWKLTG